MSRTKKRSIRFETTPVGSGAILTQFASRATVTPTAPVYGGFSLVNPSNVFLIIRGQSLATFGFTASPLGRPQLRLFDQAGNLLATNSQCAAAGGDNAQVASYYRDSRHAALDANDACMGWASGALPGGVYTFQVIPDPSAPNGAGEVLFETTPLR